jgi:hypothetical protein
MRTVSLLLFLTIGLVGVLSAADPKELSQERIDDIIQKFASKEAAFAQARELYTYKQTARVQVLDESGTPREKWETTSDIIFTGEGRRTEHVTHAPPSTLESIQMTPEDMEDLRSVQPFVLTTKELPKYFIRYLGKQTLDEISCYVFAVKPKKLEGVQRYFAGEVWVDDQDLQIVKSYGRGIGIAKNQQFPKFETYREQIDGKYWFPTYTIANDTLHFKDNDVRVRQTVKYEDYKRFKADSTITFGDVADDPKKEEPKKP